MPSRRFSGHARSRRARLRREEATSAAEARDWADGLGTDMLLAILSRVDHVDVLMSADRVCRSWCRAARDEPTLWRRVFMRGGHAGMARKLIRCGGACEAVRRSAGLCEAFCVEYAADDGLLIYLSEMAPYLKSLRLICCNNVTDQGFTEAVKELPLLEELELSLCDNVCISRVYKTIGDACIQLKHFRLSKRIFTASYFLWTEMDKDVPGIASMRRLRSLQLFSNTLSSKGLETILDNCPQLEYLDIRGCCNIYMGRSLHVKCAKIKKIRFPGDLIADYDLTAQTCARRVSRSTMSRGNHNELRPFRGNYYRYFNRDKLFPPLSR